MLDDAARTTFCSPIYLDSFTLFVQQETILNLIEKQPMVSPDLLEAISEPTPTSTPEEQQNRLETLKAKVFTRLNETRIAHSNFQRLVNLLVESAWLLFFSLVSFTCIS